MFFIRLNKVKCKKFVDKDDDNVTLCTVKKAENCLIMMIARR